MAVSTAETCSGFTARMSTLANLGMSVLSAVVLTPDSLVKELRAASNGSLAKIFAGLTRLARMKPLAKAVAILPAPRKPILRSEAMRGGLAVHNGQRKGKWL